MRRVALFIFIIKFIAKLHFLIGGKHIYGTKTPNKVNGATESPKRGGLLEVGWGLRYQL
jgi:hypothetical protein